MKPRSTRSASTTSDSPRIDHLVNRRIGFSFAGVSLKLDLSLGLFSSASVDAGSMLLLKTVARECGLDSLKRVLNAGCGSGVLGLALAARCPEASVTLIDRDRLAAAFSERNAALNGLENARAHHQLMFEDTQAQPWDLIVTNFPAKAGDSVLARYLQSSLHRLAPRGNGAIVIIRNLADRCRELLQHSGAAILREDASRGHTVFLYGPGYTPDSIPPGTAAAETDLLQPYIRRSGEFRVKRTRYTLETAWNIPDFERLSWRLALIGEMLNAEKRSGRLLFVSPGQGHLPLLCCRRMGAKPGRVILAGRDRLELLVSRRNIERSAAAVPVDLVGIPDISLLPELAAMETVDFLLTDLRPISRTDWSAALREAAGKLVKSGGEWALLGRSSDVADLARRLKGWLPLKDRRSRGWRAMILKKT